MTATDPPVGYYCFANGVKIVAGQVTEARFKTDGSLCYSVDLMPPSGTTYVYQWKDASGAPVATESYDYLDMGGRYHMVTCGGMTYSVDVASAECDAEHTQQNPDVQVLCTADPACKAAIIALGASGAAGAPGTGAGAGGGSGAGGNGGSAPTGGAGGAAGTCPANQTVCFGLCTDTLTDLNSCGVCDHPCPNRNACVQGVCTPTDDCSGDTVPCNGACIAYLTDPLNCGGCGHSCGAGQLCVGAQCVDPCAAGQLMCGTTCRPANASYSCGSCTAAACTGTQLCCSQPLDATGRCPDTAATVAAAPAFACQACPGNDSVCGGRCVDLTSDATNCGSCGEVCASSQRCMAGQCQIDSSGCTGGCAVGTAKDHDAAYGLASLTVLVGTMVGIRRRRRRNS